jgi:hypothetical protein
MAVEVAPVGVLEDGTVFYAPLGEVLHDGDDRVCCHLCGRWLRQVGGTHLRVGHGWTLAEYREAFRLLQSTPTCARDLSAGLRRHERRRAMLAAVSAQYPGGGHSDGCVRISPPSFTNPATASLMPAQ